MAVRNLAEVLDLVAEMRFDELVEVAVLLEILLLARKLERQSGFLGDPDRPVSALVSAHPAEEEQVVAGVGLARVELEIKRIRTVARPVELRHRRPLVERDRDQADSGSEVAKTLVDESGVAVERPVHRVQNRRLDEPSERDRQRARMVVDDVELGGLVEARQGVAKVRHRLADLLARRLLEDE